MQMKSNREMYKGYCMSEYEDQITLHCGFTDIEMAYMMDHRLVKMIHDYTRLREKLVQPKAQVSALKKQGGKSPGSRRTRKQRQVDNARRIGKTDTRGAIDALLPR